MSGRDRVCNEHPLHVGGGGIVGHWSGGGVLLHGGAKSGQWVG